MDNRYNLYNLEASFKNYLLAGNKNKYGQGSALSLQNNTIKNYLSDFRHFLGWLTFYFKSKNEYVILNSSRLAGQVQHDTIEEYKSYLVENRIPTKTINRRLSTLRKFCSFCISQGWMKENPAKKIGNVIPVNSSVIPAKAGIQKKWIPHQVRDDILNQFKQDILKENLDQKTITNYLDDIQEFLSI